MTDKTDLNIVPTRVKSGAMALIPQDFEQTWRLATLLSRSGQMVPDVYRDNPEACAMAIMWGMELGISPIQALQGIAPINGRAAVWGDLALALVIAHPDFVDLDEQPMLDNVGGVMGFQCTAKRRNRPDVMRQFTMADAAKAGLIAKAANKGGPWRDYPQRMLQMRARSWAMRDCFADAMRGLSSADEMRDVAEGEFEVVVKPGRAPIAEPKPKRAKDEAPVPGPNIGAVPVEEIEPGEVIAETAEAEPVIEPGQGEPEIEPVAVKVSETEAATGDLLGPGTHKPLSAGEIKMLAIYRKQAGASEQDVIDQVGDLVHSGNFKAAIDWLAAKASA